MLKALKISFSSFPSLSPNLVNICSINVRCSQCNAFIKHTMVAGHVIHLSSNYSTSEPALLLRSEKKKKRNVKIRNYTDFLEVSVERARERKTKVRTLNKNSLDKVHFDDVKCVVNDRVEPDSIILDNQKEQNNQFVRGEMKVENTDGPESSNDMDLDVDFKEDATSCQKPPPKKSSKSKYFSLSSRYIKEKLAKTKSSDLEKSGKEKNLNSSLLSYVEVCVRCGFLNRGWYTVNYYLSKQNTPVSDIRIFNYLFEGLAKNGKVDKLEEVWNGMTDLAQLKPNAVSFARRFEAIVRSTKKDKSNLLYSCLQLMEKENISIDEIFKETEWRRDAREIVLSAIEVVRPNFNLKVVEPNTHYECDLVSALNEPPGTPLVSPAESLFSADDLQKLFGEQFKLEMKTYVNVKSVDTEKNVEISENTQFCRDQLKNLESAWDKTILTALNRDISSMCAIHKNVHRNGSPINIYPYLAVLNRFEYVEIIKHEVKKLSMGSETYSPTAAILCRDLGNLVRMRYDIKIKQSDGSLKKLGKIYTEYLKWYLSPNSNYSGFNFRHAWQLINNNFQEGPSLDTESEPWPNSVLTAIGKFLYNIILRDVKVDVNILKQNAKSEHLLPAFYTVFRYQSNSTCEEVKPHPVLSRLFRLACLPNLTFSASDLPMLSPPLPWTSIRYGGYLLAKAPIIRLPNSAITQRERLKEASPNQLYPCFDSLNQLGSTPWRVNTKILDIVVKLFNSGGSEKLNVPPPPSPLPPLSLLNKSKQEKYEAFKARMLERRQRAEMYSLWCDALYRLSLANHYRERIFWLPHNMDFRGRVYPCPPHLSHLGSDLYRSLLVFAQKKPLGSKGFLWLKLHVINLTGLKKRESLASRLEYVDEVLPKILESANDPMKEGSWWMSSEEPWQTLAACLEIRDALESPDGPESYVSGFPIHQDGSCNGLQHYAAIGRDSAGAASVNLAPAPLPQDVYSCVAALVDRERERDEESGNNVAAILKGFVRRKVIKQTVMTTVYGVTRYGARLQIAKQLRDIDDFPKEHVWAASQYLVVKTFDSIREMFTSTREIQDWFTEAAHLIAGVRGESVEYVTPLGLPVVQPYCRSVVSKPFSATGKCSIANKLDKFGRPNVMKQKNAFPPNFIHSLDSTHMMLTSLYCQRAGITFVSVHDCYWTHPSSVDIMNKICREQFVLLHSQPILEDLSRFMITRYGYDDSDSSEEKLPLSVVRAKENLNTLLRNLPNKGDFELEKVLDSVYFFS